MLNYDLYKIFKEKLTTKSVLESLWDLVNDDSIIFDQYYQRNFVWNLEKCSSLIESVILGFDIPPIVIFEENGKPSEIIDGRQRFETLKRFVNNEFKLKRSGLNSLKIYSDKYFKDLDKTIQDYIKSAYLRIFRYKADTSLSNNKELIETIKKEIFRRYNIGLTPLKQYEIEKAIFIRNDLNQFIKKNLVSNLALIKSFSDMFCNERYSKEALSIKTIELIMRKVRFLISMPEIPINYYSWSSGKSDLINSVFKYISNNLNPDLIFRNFKADIALLSEFKKVFDKQKIDSNFLIYEVLHWAISVIRLENLDINILKENIKCIIDEIQSNSEIFIEEKSHYYKNIIDRYIFIAKIIERLYGTDFDKYITTSDYSRTKIKEARDIKTKKKIRKYLSKLNVSKPDSQSFTISAYLTVIQQSSFNLRPDYQREDTMDVKKASGLIESMLLDFKIAPIYIYKRKDGVQEVVDGQQRLLTILSFRNIPYTDKKGRKIDTKNRGFKLTGLKYLKEYNGLSYDELPDEAKKQLSSFSLTIIQLNETNLPNFEPVDLFIRLNNKPYPIKEHSFEMWNASINSNITQKIKDITNNCSDWFYLRNKNSNKHMHNEETITTLMYLEYMRKGNKTLLPQNTCDKFKIYAKANQLSSAVLDKKTISLFLENMQDKNINFSIDESVNDVCDYLEKLKLLLNSDDIPFKQSLNNLICQNGGKRTRNGIYLLWYILSPFEPNTILRHKNDIYNAIQNIIAFYNTAYDEIAREETLMAFREKLCNFWNLYLTT